MILFVLMSWSILFTQQLDRCCFFCDWLFLLCLPVSSVCTGAAGTKLQFFSVSSRLHVSNTHQQTYCCELHLPVWDVCSHTQIRWRRRLLVTSCFFVCVLPELLKSCSCQRWCSLGQDEGPVLLLIMRDLLPVCLHLPLHPALRCLSHSIIIFTQWKSHYILTATVEGFRAAAGQA